jgi:hypothetical protein
VADGRRASDRVPALSDGANFLLPFAPKAEKEEKEEEEEEEEGGE